MSQAPDAGRGRGRARSRPATTSCCIRRTTRRRWRRSRRRSTQGTIPMAQIDASVRRILRAKARLGLHKTRTVSLDDLPTTRRRPAARDRRAATLSQQSITLLKDDRNQVPLRVPREASVLYLSVLDYPSGWRIAAPSRTFMPELRQRWPNVTAIELSDRSTPEEIDLVRATAPRYDAIVVVGLRARGVGERPHGSGAAARRSCCSDLARSTASTPKPFVTVFFGNPVRADVRADAAGDAADLRLLRPGRGCRRSARWRARRRSPAGCRSRCRACSTPGYGLVRRARGPVE